MERPTQEKVDFINIVIKVTTLSEMKACRENSISVAIGIELELWLQVPHLKRFCHAFGKDGL